MIFVQFGSGGVDTSCIESGCVEHAHAHMNLVRPSLFDE